MSIQNLDDVNDDDDGEEEEEEGNDDGAANITLHIVCAEHHAKCFPCIQAESPCQFHVIYTIPSL